MSHRALNFAKVLVSVLLAGLLLYLVFKNVDWSEFWQKAQTVNLFWVILSIVLSAVAYPVRAYRWNILLEPLGYHLKTSRTTLAVLVGYLANLAIPRLGEITRCGVLHRNENVSMPQAFGSVVSERIVDLISLLILFLVSLILAYDRIVTFLTDAYSGLNIPNYFLFLAGGLMLVAIVVVIVLVKRANTLKGKFGEIVKSFVMGMLSLRKIKRPVGFFVSTLAIWVIYYLMSYIVVFALPETSHLGLGAGFMLLVTGGIAISMPVQSGFGTYHGMVAGMLFLYGIDKTTGLFLATLLHTSQIAAIALFGTIAIIISAIIRKQKKPD